MDKKPLLSIVTITYNHENYIQDTIKGVLMQKCNFDIEFIISNDCSTDDTHNTIIKTLKKYDDNSKIKVNYFNHKINKGMMNNFIFSINEASGKYIALCEGDDYWTDSAKIQKQVNILEKHKDIACCTHETSHISTLISKNNYLRKILSIFIYDIKLYGFKRFFYLIKTFILNNKKFWYLKRTHFRTKRKTINKLEDLQRGNYYMSFCSIVIRKKSLNSYINTFRKSDGAHYLIILIGAMSGGIYHLYDLMAVKRDQVTSVSKNISRKVKINLLNQNIDTNNKIKRLRSLLDETKNKKHKSILQQMINDEIKAINY